MQLWNDYNRNTITQRLDGIQVMQKLLSSLHCSVFFLYAYFHFSICCNLICPRRQFKWHYIPECMQIIMVLQMFPMWSEFQSRCLQRTLTFTQFYKTAIFYMLQMSTPHMPRNTSKR
jgi:hypothetical protein